MKRESPTSISGRGSKGDYILMTDIIGWNPETFSFSPEFQKQIIIAMVQEPKIFEHLGVLTSPDNFEIREYGEIFKGIQKFYNEYCGIPTKEVLFDIVEKYYHSDTLKDTISEIYDSEKISNSTLKYIEESVRNFISCQALKRAVVESLDDLGDIKKHLNVKDRIEKALMVGAALDDFGVDVYDDEEILNRWMRRKEDNEIRRISTGWSKFDQIFGGYGAGELFTFMGPAHSGKSMYLINAGANILLQKKNVLHISLEMSEEITTQRYDMRLLGLTKNELKTPKANTKIKELLNNHIGKLIIKRYPSGLASATDISTFIKRLEAVKKFVPDVLIVDYADIMRSTHKYNDRRFELDAIYQQLRNLGIEFDIPVITATQLNRSAIEKLESGGILTEEFIAESYGIARIVDCGVTINATPIDNANNNSVIYVFKNRDGEAGEQFRMFVDFSRALVREWSASSTNIKQYMKRK